MRLCPGNPKRPTEIASRRLITPPPGVWGVSAMSEMRVHRLEPSEGDDLSRPASRRSGCPDALAKRRARQANTERRTGAARQVVLVFPLVPPQRAKLTQHRQIVPHGPTLSDPIADKAIHG